MQRFRNNFQIRVISYLLPALILILIWFSLIHHYYVPNISITEEMIRTSRYVPQDAILKEIKDFFGLSDRHNQDKLIDRAEKILRGEIDFLDTPTRITKLPNNVHEFDDAPSSLQYPLALFTFPNVLLNAYEITGRDDYLLAARDMIFSYASYERSKWFPKGYLWNDGCVARRISVLSKFWMLFRNHPKYEKRVAKAIFQMVGRSAQILSKPGHFTFATNHGIMQNLALWQISLAFPTLPNIEFFRKLALERMRDQMLFYVNDEGVVLEHSAGYQKTGLQFIAMAFRYLTLLDMPIPEDWKLKHKKAEYFYAQLLRPDGTLPMFGDTIGERSTSGKHRINHDGNDKYVRPPAMKKKGILKQPHILYPVAGYSIWWEGLDELSIVDKLSQTVVAWSYFPGHAHKHADELSILLWAKRLNWWTNVGYWKYGTKGRQEAESWAGSNAPHLLNEPTGSERKTRLMSSGFSDQLFVIDLERRGPQEYVVRRQILQLKPSVWIIIDHTIGKQNSVTRTIWTTSPQIDLKPGITPASFLLEDAGGTEKLVKFILHSQNTKISQFRGSSSPFAGWVLNRPASAIAIEQPADNSWVVAIWCLQDSNSQDLEFSEEPYTELWEGPEKWKIVLPFSSGLMRISREDNQISINGTIHNGMNSGKVTLCQSSQIKNEVLAIHNAYETAAEKYPRKKYSVHRHLEVTYLIAGVFLFQEFFFLIYVRFSRIYYSRLRVLSSFCWIALGTWIVWILL